MIDNDYKQRSKEYFDMLAGKYPAMNAYSMRKAGILKAYLGGKQDVLDIGCGTGDFVRHVIGRAKKLVGLDFSHEMLMDLKAKYKEEIKEKRMMLIEADIEKSALKDGRFDLAYSYSCLYVIKDITEALKNIYRCLSKNGIAILEFQNRYSIMGLYSTLKYNHPQFFYTYPFIRNIIVKTGFYIADIKFFQLLPTITRRTVSAFKSDESGSVFLEKLIQRPPLNFLCFKYLIICRKK